MTSDIVIVLGLLGQFPLAGIAWQLVHHLHGLQRLGFQVYYVEDTSTRPYDPRLKSRVDDCSYALRFIARALQRLGLGDAWAYRDGVSGEWSGLAESRVREIFASAACAINLCGASDPAVLAFRPRGKLLYLETDPVLVQVRLAEGDTETLRWLGAHDAHFTYGENLGEADCSVPLGDVDWMKTRPPVAIDLWPARIDASCRRFTTITTWHHRGKDIRLGGQTLRWSKHLSFLTYADLPQQTSQEIELAVDIDDPADRHRLEAAGWKLNDPHTLSCDMDLYQHYILGSRGEFTVSKDVVARTRSGWFSDRTASYLAAGKPVVTQETGFSKFISTGRGLFAFSTMEQVLAAFEAINSDYIAHARAAREIAREYFDSEKLLARLLQDAGISSAG